MDFGYLQCPNREDTFYNFVGGIWLLFYTVFCGGLGFILFFFLYKKAAEQKRTYGAATVESVEGLQPMQQTDVWTPAEHAATSPPSDAAAGLVEMQDMKAVHGAKGPKRDETLATSASLLSHGGKSFSRDPSPAAVPGCKQAGYKDDRFGTAAYYTVIALTVAWIVILLLIVLDLYGMHVWTLCSAADRDRCYDALRRDPDTHLTLRTGFACGAGCLFSQRWTSGTSPFWPWLNNFHGGPQIDAIFIAAWHLTVLWFIILRVFQFRLRTCFRLRCPLDQATTVLVSRPREKEIFVEEDSLVLQTVRVLDRFRDRVLGGATVTEACKVQQDERGGAFIDVQSLRYSWSFSARKFVKAQLTLARTFDEIRATAASGLSLTEANRRIRIVGANALPLHVMTFGQDMVTEFFDWFYIYQFACLWVWAALYYWQMALVVCIVIVASGSMKVYARRRALMQIKWLVERAREVVVLVVGGSP